MSNTPFIKKPYQIFGFEVKLIWPQLNIIYFYTTGLMPVKIIQIRYLNKTN